MDSTEQQIPRPIDNRGCKVFYSGKKKRHTVKMQLWLTNIVVLLFIKQALKKEEYMTICWVYKNNHPVTPSKLVVNVVDLR
jgi:hypothetical protein